MVKCDKCRGAAEVCYTHRVGGGYGHPSRGLAFYYWCRDCAPEPQDTDMCKLESVWRLSRMMPGERRSTR